MVQFSVDGVSYSIWRKKNTTTPKVVTVKGDTLSIKDLSRSSVSWVNELYNAVGVAKAKKTSVFLVTSVVPTEGIRNFVEELLSTSEMSPVRVIFTPDKRIEDVKVKDPQVQQAFNLDLTLSVLREGVLGTVLPVPVKIKGNIQNNLNITSAAIRNKVINYIGVNLKDETLLPVSERKTELGNVDYSGVVATSGQKVMGLAQLDRDECKLVPDGTLSWDVPEGWNLEDAATIPHAYVSVSCSSKSNYCGIQFTINCLGLLLSFRQRSPERW